MGGQGSTPSGGGRLLSLDCRQRSPGPKVASRRLGSQELQKCVPLSPAPALALQHTQHAHPLRPARRPIEEAGPVRARVVDAKGPSRGLLHGHSRVHFVSARVTPPAPYGATAGSPDLHSGSTERTSIVRHWIPTPGDRLPRRAVRAAIHGLAPFTAERQQQAARCGAHRGSCAQDADARTDLPGARIPPRHRAAALAAGAASATTD